MTNKAKIISLIACGLIIILAVIFSSSSPDGLESVAEKMGLSNLAEAQGVFDAPMQQYLIPSIKKPLLSASVAGLAGAAIVFVGTMFVARRIIKRRRDNVTTYDREDVLP